MSAPTGPALIKGAAIDPAALLDDVSAVARRAGEAILTYYRGDFSVSEKDDRTPVTEADHAADDIIVPALERLTPDIPVISEERVDDGPLPDLSAGCFWLVDPLDGTREFIHHRDEFTVNIALVVDNHPALGVLGVPAQGRLYAAAGPGTATVSPDGGAPRAIEARRPAPDGLVVAASRSHANKPELGAYLESIAVKERITAGSALKFCLVAEGTADLYPRFGPTMEWDSAAGHAIVEAAGGSVTMRDGGALRYGKAGFLNPHFLVRGLPD